MGRGSEGVASRAPRNIACVDQPEGLCSQSEFVKTTTACCGGESPRFRSGLFLHAGENRERQARCPSNERMKEMKRRAGSPSHEKRKHRDRREARPAERKRKKEPLTPALWPLGGEREGRNWCASG